MKIFTEAAKLVEKNCPFAMAEIIECSGSTPRHSAQMLVLGDGKLSVPSAVVWWSAK